MTAQLTLIDHADTTTWRLDEHTKEVGRRGIAAARAELQRALAEGRSCATETKATAA